MESRKDNALSKKARVGIVLISLILLAFHSGCSNPQATPELKTNYEVDPLFREIYVHLGGEEVLGPAISPAIQQGDLTIQYMETCKMVHNPEAPLVQRFSLAPLGKELGYFESAISPPRDPSILYVDGHTIFPDFIPLYEELGARWVGKPLTEGYQHLIRNRYEQHFENVGFYIMNGSAEVHLLPYGVMACDENCSDGDFGDATFGIQAFIDPVFREYVNNHGAAFTGYVLTDAFINDQGMWEQILENVVLVADSSNNAQSVRLKPLADKLYLKSDPTESNTTNTNSYYYPTEGDFGYEIPADFFEYLNLHGGLGTSGPPVAQVSSLGNNLVHQCYSNLCLTYDPRANEGGRVRPEPLGYAYKQLFYKEQYQVTPTPETEDLPGWPSTPVSLITTETWNGVDDAPAPDHTNETQLPAGIKETPAPNEADFGASTSRAITFRIWEQFPVLGTGQVQEIGIAAMVNKQPLEGLPVDLTLSLPGDVDQFYFMPATSNDGESTLALPPINAPNGTIIPYLLCVQLNEGEKICLENSFIIWNFP